MFSKKRKSQYSEFWTMENTSRCSKNAQVALLVGTSVHHGCFGGVYGPALPDLQCLFRCSLGTMSSIFFVWGMMNAVGILLSSVLLTKIRINLLLTVAIVIASSVQAVFPYLGNVYAALIVTGLVGACEGVTFNCAVVRCNQLWPHETLPLHLIFAGFPIGSAIASLIAAPFLSGRWDITTEKAGTYGSPDSCQGFTHVHYVFLILSSFGIPLAVGSFFYFLQYRKSDSPEYAIFDSHNPATERRKGYTLFVVLFFLLLAPTGGTVNTYMNLVSTFGMESKLHLNVRDMAFVTGMFMAFFTIGRLTMAMLSAGVRQTWIILFSYVGLFVAAVGLGVFATTSEAGFIVVTCIIAVSLSPLIAASYSWAQDHVPLSGYVVAMGGIGEFIGIMIFPYITGILMSEFGPNMFMYALQVMFVCQFALFCCLFFVGRHHLVWNREDEETWTIIDVDSSEHQADIMPTSTLELVQPRTK